MAQTKPAKTATNFSDSKLESQPSAPAASRQLDDLRRLLEENLRYAKNINQTLSSNFPKDLEKLLKQNLKISQELLEDSKKIKRWIVWQRTWGILKILIIAVPIVLGIIYLPPLLNDLVKPFRDLLNFNQ